MKKRQSKRRSLCPIAFTLDIIGDRWAMLIIRDIIFSEKSSFGEFSKSEEGIASNILTDRLKRLEEQDIITKKPDADNLSKNNYSLTQKGLDLLPIMIEMIVFAGQHDQQTPVPKRFLNKLKRDRKGCINDFRKKIKQQ